MVERGGAEDSDGILSVLFDQNGKVNELNYRDVMVVSAGTGRSVSDVMADYYALTGCIYLIVRPAVWVGRQVNRARSAICR